MSGRFLGTLALLWTAACGAWLGWTALEGKLDTLMVAIAVVGFAGIVWLIGLLIVLIFWIGRAEPDGDPSKSDEGGVDSLIRHERAASRERGSVRRRSDRRHRTRAPRMLRDTSRNVAAISVALAVPALVVLAVAVRGGPTALDVVDPSLAALRVGLLDALLDAVDLVGSLPVWAFAVATLTVRLARTELRLGAEAFVVAVGAEIAVTAIKVLVGRARPPGAELADLLVAAGFPSGHVTRTAVLVGILIALAPWTSRRPRLAIALGLVAVALMGLARVSSGAHFTSDVVGACLLAAGILAVWLWLSPAIAGRRSRTSRRSERRPPCPSNLDQEAEHSSVGVSSCACHSSQALPRSPPPARGEASRAGRMGRRAHRPLAHRSRPPFRADPRLPPLRARRLPAAGRES